MSEKFQLPKSNMSHGAVCALKICLKFHINIHVKYKVIKIINVIKYRYLKIIIVIKVLHCIINIYHLEKLLLYVYCLY